MLRPGSLVLITGAAGFIGSNVARKFALADYRVVASDRMRQGAKWRNLVNVPLHDLIVPEALPGWLERHGEDVALVVNLGAVSATTETDVDRIVRDNIRLSFDLWDWCARQHVALIYASSAATYGEGTHGFTDDDAPSTLAQYRPLNAYGWSKHIVDRRFIADRSEGRPMPPSWAGLKFFNVYGPGEDHKGEMRSVVNKIMPLVSDGSEVNLFRSYRPDYTDGGQMRDFVYVNDVVDIIAWLSSKQGLSGIYNVGSGRARTWNDLANAVFTAASREPRITYIEMPAQLRPQYQYYTEAPMTKLLGEGWNQPMTSLEDGVRAYWDSWGARG